MFMPKYGNWFIPVDTWVIYQLLLVHRLIKLDSHDSKQSDYTKVLDLVLTVFLLLR